MRILQISDVYFPRVGGVSTSIRTFLSEFNAKGHAVTLLAPDYGVPADEPSEDVLRVAARRVPFAPEDRMMKGGRIMELGARLRGAGYDLVHVHTPFVAHYLGLALARRLGIPIVESYHTFFEEYLHYYVRLLPKGVMRFLARDFSRAQCNSVDRVIVPSSAMGEVLRGYGVRTPVTVVPTGIRPHLFQGGDGARFRSRLGIEPGRAAMVYIGRVAREKNLEFLVEVLRVVRRRLPAVLLVVAGEGPAERALHGRVESTGLGENVRFVGNLDRTRDLLDAYRAADCFVFASRTESQGLALLEAMACGTPVVALAAMGTKDILGPGCGAVTAPEDVGEFAEKVVGLLTDPDRRARLGEEGRAYVQEWSASAMAERMLDCYHEVLATRAPGLARAAAR